MGFPGDTASVFILWDLLKSETMDSLSHLLFVFLVVTPLGWAPYRLVLKIASFSALIAGLAFVVFGTSSNFIYICEVVAHSTILYILYLMLVKKKPLLRFFMASLSAVVIAGFSHNADMILIWMDKCPPWDSPFRPHNFWHSPLFALFLSAIVVIAVPPLLNFISKGVGRVRKIRPTVLKPKFLPALSATYLGYLTHIFADTLIHDFDIWWLFPFSNIHFSLYDLANQGFRYSDPSPANPWGWWYYYLNPALIIAAFVFCILSYFARRAH